MLGSHVGFFRKGSLWRKLSSDCLTPQFADVSSIRKRTVTDGNWYVSIEANGRAINSIPGSWAYIPRQYVGRLCTAITRGAPSSLIRPAHGRDIPGSQQALRSPNESSGGKRRLELRLFRR